MKELTRCSEPGSVTLQACVYCPRTAVSAAETSSGLSLPKVGLKRCFCPVSSYVRGGVLSATNDAICQPFSAGRSFQTHGDDSHKNSAIRGVDRASLR